jgi:hypothetical protein
MTLEEKVSQHPIPVIDTHDGSHPSQVNLTAGVTASNGCSGNIPAIARLGFPGLCLNDAGNGVRGPDLVNAYASGISVGASWNRNLSDARGYYMGNEFRTKGVNVALGPVVGPLGRMAEGGRNWEGRLRLRRGQTGCYRLGVTDDEDRLLQRPIPLWCSRVSNSFRDTEGRCYYERKGKVAGDVR